MIQITYNTLDFSQGFYNITGFDGYNMPGVDIKSIELAREDGAIQTAHRLTSRTLTVEGQIKTDNKPNLIAAIRTLKQYLYQPKGTLTVIDDDDVPRTYEDVTPQNVAITRARGGATQARYSITFFCPKPYSVAEQAELINTNITTSPVSIGFVVQGSYPASPIITLTINSITAGLQTITVGNETTSRTISITDTFEAGDTVLIDTKNKNVYVNTLKVDYSGAFAKWDVGGGSLSYVDTADARDVDIIMTADVRDI